MVKRSEIVRDSITNIGKLNNKNPISDRVDQWRRQKDCADIFEKYRPNSSIRDEEGSGIRAFLSHDSKIKLNDGLSVEEAARRLSESFAGVKIYVGGRENSASGDIVADIQKKVQICDIFIAVVTPEHGSSRRQFNEDNFPSPWITLEIGVALGLGKTIGLLVSDDVDEEYCRRLFSHWQRVPSKDIREDFEIDFKETLDFALSSYLSKLVSESDSST